MHTLQRTGLRLAACGSLVVAFAAGAQDATVPPGAAAAVIDFDMPMPPVPERDVSMLGRTVDPGRLAGLRGGDGTQTENLIDVDGSVDGNTAHHIVSGSNSIADGAFNNASGINTVIQNTGSNVLIQNAMIVTVDFAGGPQ